MKPLHLRIPVKLLKKVDDRHRLAEEITLDIAAAVPLGCVQLVSRLDTFGDPVKAEVLAEIDDRGDQTAAKVGVDIGHEAAVDLDLVQRQTVDEAQAGIARAEIIEG